MDIQIVFLSKKLQEVNHVSLSRKKKTKIFICEYKCTYIHKNFHSRELETRFFTFPL